MPTYGRVKVDTITYDLSGTATDVSVANIATKASPTFTGTVTVPTASANDNTTKAASTAYVQTELGDYALKAGPTFTGTINAADLVLSGDLTVNGSTTTIDTTTLQVEDKNIQIGKVSTPSDATADGGGLTLLGATNKTWNWVNSTDAWTSSEHINLPDNKKLLVGAGDDMRLYSDGNYGYVQGDELRIGTASNTTNAVFTNTKFDFRKDVDLTNTAKLAIGGAYGSSGQVLTSGGSGAAPSWAAVPAGGNSFEAVAEGAIAANKPVYLSRTNGKVIQAAETTTSLSTPQAGSQYAASPSDTRSEGFCSVGGNYFWFGYKHGNQSDRGYAKLGIYNSSSDTFTFSGNTQFSSNDPADRITPVYDSTANRFMVVWRSGTGNSRNLSYVVGNLSGTTLSYGSQVEFQATTGNQDHQHGKSLNGAFDSNNRGCCWIWQRHYSAHETYVRAAQISTGANSASLGSRTTIISGQQYMYGCDIVFDSNVNRYLIAYAYITSGNEYKLSFKVGNPSSGTSISWGTEYTINYGGTVVKKPKLAFDPDSNLVLCIANDNTNDDLLQFPLRITGGSTNTVVLADSNGGTVIDSAGSGYYEINYDTLVNKIVLFFRDNSNSGRPAAKFGTYSENYSGTNDYYTWSSSTELSTTNMNASGSEPSGGDDDPGEQPLAVLPTGGRAFGYYANGAQRVSIIKSSNTTHNLTGHDYVGFPDAAYSDGQTVTVKTEGNVQSGFSGLTSQTMMYGDTQNNVTSASSGAALSYQTLGRALGTDKIHIKVSYQ